MKRNFSEIGHIAPVRKRFATRGAGRAGGCLHGWAAKRAHGFWLAVVLLAAALVGSGCATFTAESQGAVLRAKNQVAPALVHIRPVKEVFTGGERREFVVSGSGFIISPEGYVITNEHVAAEAQHVRCVLFNQDEVDADVVGTDPFTDIAVLKLDTDAALPVARLGTSGSLEAGQTVLALGSPHGLSRSVSKGIISVTNRYLPDRGPMVSPYNTWIQTDAAINPGNSGGPLVNLRGEVVGVNARALVGADNIGFAIPIDIVREVVAEIIEKGRVERAFIGADLQEMTRMTDDPDQQGVVVGGVDPMSPAAEAGMLPGDVLTHVDGTPVHARYDEQLPIVRNLIANLEPGSEARFTVVRGGENIELTMVPTEMSELKGQQIEFREWGFTASDVTPTIQRMAQLPSQEGIVVSGTQVGSIAANSGLQQNDIVLSVDNEHVKNLAHFKQLYDARVESKQRLIMLDVQRGAVTRYVLVKQDAAADEAAVLDMLTPEGGIDLGE